MHYRLLVTFDQEQADNSAEARAYVSNVLLEDGSFFGGRFGKAHADWFVAGGRWSGALSRATWAQAIQAEIEALEREHNVRIWGVHYGDPEKQKLQEKLKAEIEALYASAIPELYQGAGLVYNRDTYRDHGYEDDAMPVSEELYQVFLAPYAGADLVTDEFQLLTFVDLDYDVVNPQFIGKKWLVVVDVHI